MAIEKVLDRSEAASLAIVQGLISAQQWPGRSLCYYPIGAYASEFHLSDSQVELLERLRQAAEIGPRRDLALAVLDDAQKALFAEFETALELAREAIELGLIPGPAEGRSPVPLKAATGTT
jgi:hypothetical protein